MVAGIPYGVMVAGVGSRLTMLLLRVTSPERVIGMQSDDDFTIGRFTIAGTYNLLLIGAIVGIVGAAAYRAVAPQLIGPNWFRHLTVGLASGAVVGSMLIHPDGVDFTELKPTWLAIVLFVALPALFGAFIGTAVDAVGAANSWTSIGRRRWLLPVATIALFPPTIVAVLIVSAAVALAAAIGEIEPIRNLRKSTLGTLAIRTAWLLIALAGLSALIQDITTLTSAGA